MLSERKAAILQAVVEGYIATSEPVGSTQVVRDAGLSVSSATVRSELSALEDAGYLMQPHTSAGRIPSDKGYRYFVDSLMQPATLGPNQERKVSSFFAAAQGELERMLRDTSSFLAQLTDYASVVVAAPAEASRVRAIHTVRIADDQTMVVIVHANTAIDKVLVPIDPSTTDAQLDAAGALIAACRIGGGEFTGSGDSAIDLLATRLLEAIDRPATEAQAFVGGTSAVAGLFDAVERVQDVLLILEKQYLVVSIIRDIIDRGLNVAIGHETGLEPLADCAIVVAPVEVDGRVTGSIGLLGPSRMHYPEAVATVALVSKQLGRRLSEGPSS
jgi:heat-inducible transcriptional repressor